MSAVNTRSKLMTAGAVLIAVAVALGLYFSNDSGAREKKGVRGPAAIPVAVTPALQQSVPVRQQAIGNVEPYSSVAV